MDIAAVGALLNSLKTATDIAKFIRTSDLTIEKAETKLKLAELVSALADAKLDAAEIHQALLERDERIRSLESEAKVRASLVWREPCYWISNQEGVNEPYCQACYDDTKKLSRLHTDNDGHFQCRVCSKSFNSLERKKRNSAALRNVNLNRSSSTWGR